MKKIIGIILILLLLYSVFIVEQGEGKNIKKKVGHFKQNNNIFQKSKAQKETSGGSFSEEIVDTIIISSSSNDDEDDDDSSIVDDEDQDSLLSSSYDEIDDDDKDVDDDDDDLSKNNLKGDLSLRNNDDDKDSIFVDSNNGKVDWQGTMDQPVIDFYTGYLMALRYGKKSVYVANGIYYIPTINLVEGISIYGGYSGYPNWKRENITIPYTPTTQFISLQSIAFNISKSLRPITLSHFSILPKNGTNDFVSSYGIIISESSNVTLRFINIQSGFGRDGIPANTLPHVKGVKVEDGEMGNVGCIDGSSSSCGHCNAPSPGNGGSATCYHGDGNSGGNGGKPGRGNQKGQTGRRGHPFGSAGGNGSLPFLGNQWPADGTRGLNGDDGLNGKNANYSRLYFGRYFVMATIEDGQNGQNGQAGGGGGGGGGGLEKGRHSCKSYGGSGGGGGGGGCGGRGGRGGNMGGSSIGVYLFNSTFISIQYCNITTSKAGNGSPGSLPESGLLGGIGGKGYVSTQAMNSSMGGDGGNGGRGGNGGQGAGGRGGLSVPILMSNTKPSITCNYLSYGSSGTGANGIISGYPGISANCYSDYKIYSCAPEIDKACIRELVNMSCEFGEIRDACGVCSGNNSTCVIGCDGIPGSTAKIDACGVCNGDNSTCIGGCDHQPGSTKVVDACGVCGGNNSTCLSGCDNQPYSTLVFDICGVCGGHNNTCSVGCDGIKYSYKKFDKCGVCGGDGSTCSTPSNSNKKQRSSNLSTAAKIIISVVVITVSLYGGILAFCFVKRRVNPQGSQYYRTKLILEYDDAPFVQAELIKKKHGDGIMNAFTNRASEFVNGVVGNHDYQPFSNEIQMDSMNNSGVHNSRNNRYFDSPSLHYNNNNNYYTDTYYSSIHDDDADSLISSPSTSSSSSSIDFPDSPMSPTQHNNR